MLNIASENNHLINTCSLFFSRAEELETELMKMVKLDNQWQLSARVYLKFIKKLILEVVLSAYYVTLQNICAVIALKRMCLGFLPPSSLSRRVLDFFFPLKLCWILYVHFINLLQFM